MFFFFFKILLKSLYSEASIGNVKIIVLCLTRKMKILIFLIFIYFFFSRYDALSGTLGCIVCHFIMEI